MLDAIFVQIIRVSKMFSVSDFHFCGLEDLQCASRSREKKSNIAALYVVLIIALFTGYVLSGVASAKKIIQRRFTGIA